ncbi:MULTISPECIES: type 1 fimbrial major subunit FimA [Pantoea]|jgi:type 1 fimbria pilin|uniref:Type 1 fimbrial major subunit FimA n=1 Tax=Pantoea piersonii TaxID=2364647 RepID=A0AAJ5QN65_9GAMM|nr:MULTISPECIES: type 1 fimbrial major subunit FimA [Pantoea]MBZ6387468.1 type 1 fimbrial major subunit FimA [Pantoea piersonii]MBZ6400736.1 type 1 fimbrial major subunit FimA [Pantoea piersonii]MBZ6408892.1 type 1 fimbrial major subunit FimA [Pantoea piersonii]MBZ6427075.1 type 1 fimbrial major subunit FimA [Pantoea piersonii]NYB04370.1 fimbrial protein [Pantoea piersonii]
MKLKTIAVTMGTALALFAGAANAGDPPPAPPTVTVNGGTVHFKGKLVAAPCSVSTDTSDQEVKLGEYTTHHFKTAGQLGAVVPFQIKLEDCDSSVAKTAAVAFSGRADSTTSDSSLLGIDQDLSGGNSGTASNIAIQVLDNQSKPVKFDGSTFVNKTTLIDGENILKFAAQYKSTGVATAGDANADANFIMQYN